MLINQLERHDVGTHVASIQTKPNWAGEQGRKIGLIGLNAAPVEACKPSHTLSVVGHVVRAYPQDPYVGVYVQSGQRIDCPSGHENQQAGRVLSGIMISAAFCT